jgi:hypothetical protein
VTAPFTIEQFLGVFAAYNYAIWPIQLLAYGLGLIAVSALWFRTTLAAQLILSILALMWAVNGVGYHFLFFAEINPLAKGFAAFFVLQSILFAVCVLVPSDLRFEMRRNFRSAAALSFIVYALLIYELLGCWAGHGLMAGPLFGVAPCPTTIFTIGMLLLARGGWVVWLSIIPLLWSLVGLAAALQLGIPEDFGLQVAGFGLVSALIIEKFRTWGNGPIATKTSLQ